MEKYLTEKARPGRIVMLAENLLGAGLFVLLILWASVGVYGFLKEGFVPLTHLLMVLMAIPFLMALSWIVERKRARKHAQVILGALATSDEALELEEMEKQTGVRQLHKTINSLVAKGYVRNVTVQSGRVQLKESLLNAICAHCGAKQVYAAGDAPRACPSCGSTNIKY